MNSINQQQVLMWHLQQAKFHAEAARSLQRNLGIIPSNKHGEDGGEIKTPSQITAEQLEKSVQEKSGRVKDLAKRLSTSEEIIEELIANGAKVQRAGRGWIKPIV